jgi:hypothetical protein
MKTIPTSTVSSADLDGAVQTSVSAGQCTIYYAGDTPLVNTPSQADIDSGVESAYDIALTAHFNSVAAARHYDTYVTAALRAGYPGPFQTEGIAFGAWMDSCNAQGYALIAAVRSGAKPIPTIADFIASLPAMVWPI